MANALFGVLDAIFTKAEPPEKPNMWVLHRFLASDPDYAELAAQLQSTVYDDEMAFRIWQLALPRARKAPYFHYVASKKPPATTAIIERIMEVYALNRSRAEEALALIEEIGTAVVTSGAAHPSELLPVEDLHIYLGVEWDRNDGETGTG